MILYMLNLVFHDMERIAAMFGYHVHCAAHFGNGYSLILRCRFRR